MMGTLWGPKFAGFYIVIFFASNVSLAMYAAVRLTAVALPGNALLRLTAEILVGILVYAGLSKLFRLEAFREVVTILKQQIARK